jgi:hypothetical protein
MNRAAMHRFLTRHCLWLVRFFASESSAATILCGMMSAMHVRRFWVSGAVFAVAIALLPFSFHSERHLETATRVEGSQAETVRQELATRFRSPFVDRVALVVQGLPPADSAEGGRALEIIEEQLKDQPGVAGVVSYLDLRDPVSWAAEVGHLFWSDSSRPRALSKRWFQSFTRLQPHSKTNCAAVIRG